MKKDGNVSSRRRFMSLSLLGGASLIAGPAQGQNTDFEGEAIPMLTPDGKLVKVKKEIVENAHSKTRVRNADILDWMETDKKSRQKDGNKG